MKQPNPHRAARLLVLALVAVGPWLTPGPNHVPDRVAAMPARQAVPGVADVAELTPADAVAYLSGRRDGCPDVTADAINNFSAADILETMDTTVLDEVRRTRGDAALARLYETIARAVLDSLIDTYGDQPVVLALDAGHGGARSYWWDPGSEGTEAGHNRAVVAAIERLADQPAYRSLLLRRIFNDSVADDFRVSADRNEMVFNQLTMRQSRASLLAQLTARWNADHPDTPAAMHEVSVHFNAGANGLLVLYQAPGAVERAYAERSRAYAERYAARAIDAINATGLLPAPLRLWAGNGLHDDVMMYRPAYISAAAAAQSTPRYSVLQGNVHLRRYVDVILEAWR